MSEQNDLPTEPTLFRDPRTGVVFDGGKHRVYVFSYPDPLEAKQWAEERGIPAKFWEEEEQRVKVMEPYVQLALSLPQAPKKVLEAIVPSKPRKPANARLRK